MKKILIYVGYQVKAFNHHNFKTERLSSAEHAAYCLAKKLIEIGYDVTIGGEVLDGEEDKLKFKSLAVLRNQLETYHAVISSSYIHYLIELQDYVTFSRSFLWLHDNEYYDWWNGIQIPDSKRLLSSQNLNGIVCLSKSHAENITSKYGYITPCHIIEHGIDYSMNNEFLQKEIGSYIYTSPSNKGLKLVLKMWPLIKKYRPDATLRIFTHPDSDDMSEYDFKLDGVILHANEPMHIINMWLWKSEYWLCPSDLEETHGDDILYAQFARAYPIISTSSALIENSLHAIKVNHTNKSEEELVKEYVDKILAANAFEVIRARENNFNWVKDKSWDRSAMKWKSLIR